MEFKKQLQKYIVGELVSSKTSSAEEAVFSKLLDYILGKCHFVLALLLQC